MTTWRWVLVAALVGLGWVAGGGPVAEALDGWTARLAEMTLAEYPPGYGVPDLF